MGVWQVAAVDWGPAISMAKPGTLYGLGSEVGVAPRSLKVIETGGGGGWLAATRGSGLVRISIVWLAGRVLFFSLLHRHSHLSSVAMPVSARGASWQGLPPPAI